MKKENKTSKNTFFLEDYRNSQLFPEQERWNHISNILCIIRSVQYAHFCLNTYICMYFFSPDVELMMLIMAATE